MQCEHYDPWPGTNTDLHKNASEMSHATLRAGWRLKYYVLFYTAILGTSVLLWMGYLYASPSFTKYHGQPHDNQELRGLSPGEEMFGACMTISLLQYSLVEALDGMVRASPLGVMSSITAMTLPAVTAAILSRDNCVDAAGYNGQNWGWCSADSI